MINADFDLCQLVFFVSYLFHVRVLCTIPPSGIWTIELPLNKLIEYTIAWTWSKLLQRIGSDNACASRVLRTEYCR